MLSYYYCRRCVAAGNNKHRKEGHGNGPDYQRKLLDYNRF